MESNLKNNTNQFEHFQIIPEEEKCMEQKPNVLIEYQKLMKRLEVDEYNVNYYEPLYPDAIMIYPIKPWTFWYRNPTKSQSRHLPWEKSLTKVETVSDVTRLWEVLNRIIQPSVKIANTSLFVFNENSVPAWEHKSNENAGRWMIVLNNNHDLHKTWNEMILQVVGDKFASVAADINGIGLHVKPLYSKITVWTTKTTKDNYKNIIEIGVMSMRAIGPAIVKRMYYLMHNRLPRS